MKWLFLAGFLVHLIFFYSIFDIYFTSPLVHGMTPHSTQIQPPARRLVLFVADGLRADKLFELDKDGETRAPYLRNIVKTRGAWGVSHTRVPTESRPGHVALIAGFYEDVSAVAKGWKENPVEFDSVFNQSRFTWSWGSPDILPMFAKGATGDHVFTKMYPAESEDFAGADTSQLDTWVFDCVKDFISEARQNGTIDAKLKRDKVVLFLHLLGLDTNGHAHKPYSDEYLSNVRIVDNGVKDIVEEVENYFDHDSLTAYILTSDHGMTNWGSHGAGHPSETLTPLIAWGPGIRGPRGSHEDKYTDGFSNDWNLSNIGRSDVQQADVAPLMASLIGLSYPLNSVGKLPIDYLDNTDQFKAESMFTNAQQILQQFEVKMKQKQESTLAVFFTPFSPLTASKRSDLLRRLKTLLSNKDYQQVIKETEYLIKIALDGLTYYHHYDRFFLGTSIGLGFSGWMTYIVCLILQDHTTMTHRKVKLEEEQYQSSVTRTAFSIVGSLVFLLLFVQSLPLTHYIYALLPVVLWYQVAKKKMYLQEAVSFLYNNGYLWTAIITAVLWLCGLEIIAMSFFYRGVLSLGLLAMAFWPLLTKLRQDNKHAVYGWMMSCIILAIFPLLPVVGRKANYSLVMIAGICGILISLYCAKRSEVGLIGQISKHCTTVKVVYILQVLFLLLSVYIVNSTANSIERKEGLPLINQIISWTILGFSFILPMISTTMVYPRLLSVALTFMGPYILLSTSHEGLFYLTLCYLLFYWLKIEKEASNNPAYKLEMVDFSEDLSILDSKRKLIASDLRCSYIFIFLLITSFFGTGNIASINSFDPSTVYCFLTVFNPFVMGILLMWKNLIPFVLVTCTFQAIHAALSVPTQSLFLIVLLMSDLLGLHFFFLVQDYGSWLEIGTSISHYVIVMCMILFLLVLLGVSTIFTRYSLCIGTKKHRC